MSCCGNKKDVAPQSQKDNSEAQKPSIKSSRLPTQVRAVKVYGVDDEVKIQGTPKGYRAVP